MLCSLWDNNIGDQGAIALAAILKETKITDLKCALASNRLPIVFANVSTPIDTATPHLCSLGHNQLCGLDRMGDGTYTSEGITKLCKALKGSAVTSLKCAAAPECSLSCQRPLTLPLPTFAAWATTNSAALTTEAAAPTPPRASPSCARGSRGAP